jgi:16S rRNA (guanine527-N7)-methyltransferase
VSDDLSRLLLEGASRAGLQLPDNLADRLIAYYQLLWRWNRKINLTSIATPPAGLDRLLLEPLAAAQHLPSGLELIDLGSGGGSPAIPLALALGAPRLTMVESRGRKAAFLREALRAVELPGAVENLRFEELAATPVHQRRYPLLSLRAVRVDRATLNVIGALLEPRGTAALFQGADRDVVANLPVFLELAGEFPLVEPEHRLLLLRCST